VSLNEQKVTLPKNKIDMEDFLLLDKDLLTKQGSKIVNG
jgi:hypothetical protein